MSPLPVCVRFWIYGTYFVDNSVNPCVLIQVTGIRESYHLAPVSFSQANVQLHAAFASSFTAGVWCCVKYTSQFFIFKIYLSLTSSELLPAMHVLAALRSTGITHVALSGLRRSNPTFLSLSFLPPPTQLSQDQLEEEEKLRVQKSYSTALVSSRREPPPYGHRKGWVPRSLEVASVCTVATFHPQTQNWLPTLIICEAFRVLLFHPHLT